MRINSVQFLTNSSIMMSTLFIPLLAEEMGADYTQVGIIVSVYAACLFFSSFIFSRAADAWNIKKLLLLGLAASSAAYFLQIFAYDPLSLALIRGLLGICVGMYPAALIMHVYGMKRSIGKFSSFGSLGWAAGFFGAGLIKDLDLIFLSSSLMVTASLIIASGLKEVHLERIKVDYFSMSTVLKNRNIYLSFFLRHTGAAGCWTIFPLYMISIGADMFQTGLIYTINPLMQFFIMRRMDGKNMELAVKAGYLLSAVSFLSLILVKMYYQVLPSMFLVALSWSLLLVGSTELLLRRNDDKATASGLLNSAVSLAMIVGALLGGVISNYFGFQAVFAAAGILSLAGLLIFSGSFTPWRIRR